MRKRAVQRTVASIGGPVGCYLIQIRSMMGPMNENPWRLVATIFKPHYELTAAEAENLNSRCELRIIAANKARQSCPSNTVVALLSTATENASATA